MSEEYSVIMNTPPYFAIFTLLNYPTRVWQFRNTPSMFICNTLFYSVKPLIKLYKFTLLEFKKNAYLGKILKLHLFTGEGLLLI